jgi:hypothetical protein
MNYARLLADGVGSWLQYERACGHSGLFSEKYLAQPIGHILSGRSGNRTLAEFTHSVLAPRTRTAGRRPAIDFAVCEAYPSVAIGVESKWVGTTLPSIENIAWDLIRLELLAYHESARCYFLLGGKRKDLERLFGLAGFWNVATDRKRKPLLKHDASGEHTITIGPIDRARTPMLEDVFERYADLSFPSRIVTHRSTPFPVDQIKDGYQVYVWQIRSAQPRTTFLGGNMRQYFPRKSD